MAQHMMLSVSETAGCYSYALLGYGPGFQVFGAGGRGQDTMAWTAFRLCERWDRLRR